MSRDEIMHDLQQPVENKYLDLVNVVRCKYCRHWKSNEFYNDSNCRTSFLNEYPCKRGITSADWFCAFGDRG